VNLPAFFLPFGQHTPYGHIPTPLDASLDIPTAYEEI